MSNPAGRFGRFTPHDEQWTTLVVKLPPESIQRLCVTFEGYDNLALVRTPWRGSGCVHIYTHTANLRLVKKILNDIGTSLPVTIADIAPGMKDLDALWQEQ